MPQDPKARQPLANIQQKSKVSVKPQQQQQQQQQIVQQQQTIISNARIDSLENELRKLREQLEQTNRENEMLKAAANDHQNQKMNAIVHNNRLRQLFKLREENKLKDEKIAELEERLNDAERPEPFAIKQNVMRARKIHQQSIKIDELEKENAELKKKSKQQEQQPIAAPSPSKVNYSHVREQIRTAGQSNYGIIENHLPGEC
ncbi:hypothetical protein SAMD00019534_064560 [Acytostelium subglobosum LB1]|uniref:hypothetical protein n=1 Tax=Acytostelium subglobosum LB1 TaxID=1410327 RepID=UPI000644F11A|nr:hypothetical protein SAMD00019534_064560 [Acytostelium subglobosum LB1]GAM23281.1 hypothetical protein SAMD00019534_064560 [Acytostelium subglobosum LB1]|eukprot:XP_012753730.1 hypothetical protein SAMD00019534_064560 [Acytostelium subglobosum LB1]